MRKRKLKSLISLLKTEN